MRSNGPRRRVYGKFLSGDPKCYWETPATATSTSPSSNRHRPASGDLLGSSHVLIAVTKGSTPTTNPDDWHHYAINTTNDGAEPLYGGGPQTAATTDVRVSATSR